MNSNLSNCLIYSRISTDIQSNESAIESLKAFATYKKYDVLGIFQDTITGKGKASDRTGFKELQNFVESNQVENILVWELSRLGRNLKDILTTLDYFTDKKINVCALKENINTLNEDKTINPTSQMTLQILGSVAMFERTSIIERTKRGLHHHLKNGGSFSLSQYGFTSIEKQITVDENEAKIVRLIYSMFLSGVASPSIAKHLNLKNIPSKKDVKWNDSQIRDILHSTSYIGEKVYNFGMVEIPAIISKADHLKAQQIFDKNQNLNKDKAIFENYLSGLVKCGKCGLGYYQHARQNKNDFSYKCMSTRKTVTGQLNESCGNSGIGINILNSIVYNSIICELLLSSDKKKMNTIIKSYTNTIQDKKNNIKREIKEVKQERNQANEKQSKLLRFLLNETISESEYIGEKEKTQTIIENLTTKLNQLLVAESDLIKSENVTKDNQFISIKERFKHQGIEATSNHLLVDLEQYKYYCKNIVKSVIVTNCSVNDNELLPEVITPIHQNRIMKIEVTTLFNTYSFYTVNAFNKYTYQLLNNELTKVDMIKEIMQ